MVRKGYCAIQYILWRALSLDRENILFISNNIIVEFGLCMVIDSLTKSVYMLIFFPFGPRVKSYCFPGGKDTTVLFLELGVLLGQPSKSISATFDFVRESVMLPVKDSTLELLLASMGIGSDLLVAASESADL